MQTVGIFGDSFCQAQNTTFFAYQSLFGLKHNDIKLTRFKKFYNKGFPRYWNMLNGYNSTANGVGASDVYSAFLNFCANHYKFDRVVFFVTNRGRQSIWAQHPKKEENLNTQYIQEPSNWIHQPGLSFNRADTYTYSKILKRIAKAVYSYQENALVVDQVREGLFVNLIIDKLKQIRPDTCVVECFPWPQTVADKFIPCCLPKSTMMDISNLEIEKWNISTPNWNSDILDLRENHMTRESHTIFAKILQSALDNHETHLQFDIEKFQHITPDKDLYIIKNSPKAFAKYLKKLGWNEELA